MHSHGAVDWPLVGRAEELRYLGEALGRPGATGAVLMGPAGVGKTRLARELTASVDGDDGVDCEWVIATRAAATIPFGPLVHLLPGARVGGAAERTALFAAAADALAARAGRRSLVLGVDDAHLLDASSAALILHLVLTGTTKVVATVRTGEPVEDPIIALWKDGGALRLDLQALSEAETGAMVSAGLAGHVERATSTWIYQSTQGNPLFVSELVTGALEAGTMVRAGGGAWRWNGRMVPTRRLMDAVGVRLASVSPPGRRALELLALGEPLDVALLEALTGSEAIVEADRAGFVSVEGEAAGLRLRLAHPLYGEVLRAAMPPMVARARYRELADAMAQVPGETEDDVVRQVVWRLESGGTSSPELLVRAAERASSQLDHELARRLAQRACDAGGGFHAALALGEACNRLQLFTDAEAALAPWEEAHSDDAAACRYLYGRVHALHWGQGCTADAHSYLERAGSSRPQRWWGQLVRAVQAHLLALDGHLDEALELGRPLTEETGVDERARLQAASPVAMALSLHARTDTALAVLDRASASDARPWAELGDIHTWLQAQRIVALLVSGRLRELEDLLVPMHVQAVERRDHHARASSAMLLGRVALQRGMVGTARRWLEEAISPARGADPGGVLSGSLAVLSQAQSQAGDVSGARAAWEEAMARRRPPSRWQEGDLAVAEVWLVAAEGDLVRAAQLARHFADDLAATPYFSATLLHQAVRLGSLPAPGTRRLTSLGMAAESPWIKGLAAHARALAADDGAALEQAASTFEGFGALLMAAEASSQAARAHHRGGLVTVARRCAARSRHLAERCVDARSPALVIDDTLPLTGREREVAVLAGRGLTNGHIADRLVLSVRTVESHLYRVYAKLGVHRREDLALLVQGPTSTEPAPTSAPSHADGGARSR